MGNFSTAKFKRGTIDVELSDIIQQMTDEQYLEFLNQAAENGQLDVEDFADDRGKLIERLPDFPDDVKIACRDSVLEGKSPF